MTATLLQRWPQRRATTAAVLLLLFGLSAAWTWPTVTQATTQDGEEVLMNAVTRVLPSRPVCVVRIGDFDPPAELQVHRYHPDYRWRSAGHRVLSITDALAGRGACRETYFIQGLRCYARDRRLSGGPGLVRACAELHRRVRLVPRWRRTWRGHREDPFGWWRGQQSFDLGVYQITR